MSQRSHTVTLENGMTLVYVRNEAAPVLALDVWIRAGSADEREDEAGLAHVVEHMMFKGTGQRGPGVIAGEVENMGGEINAFTSFDHTVYTLCVPGRYGAQAFDIVHDALTGSLFDSEELEREKLVILEEIKRGRDHPQQYLSRMLFSTAYQRHPYKNPVIGSAELVSSFTRENLKRFVSRWYRSSNMTLVAVGELPIGKVKKMAEATFGKMDRSPVPRRTKRAAEGEPDSFRCSIEGRDIAEIYFDIAFPGPGADHRDVVQLDLMAAVLGNGEASRLEHRIKLDLNLVHAIGAGVYLPTDPGVINIGGAADPAKFEEAYREICSELYRIAHEPVSATELKRAKDTVETEFIYQRETSQAQAQKLGYCQLVLGDADYEALYLERLHEVTPDELMGVAQKYIAPRRGVVTYIHPRGEKPPLSVSAAKAAMQKAEKKWSAKKKTVKKPPVMSRYVLDNGARVLVRRQNAVPIVSVRAAMLGGSRVEQEGKQGLFHLLSAAVTRGTGSRSVFDIAHDSDRIGGHIEGFSGRNSFGVKSEFLSKHLEKGVELLCDTLTTPTFPDEEVEKSRIETLSALKRRDDNPAAKAFRAFERALFSPHPYGIDPLGTVEGVQNLSPDDLRGAYGNYASAEGLAIAVSGDVEPEAVVELFNEKLKLARTGRATLEVKLPKANPAYKEVLKVESPHEQAHVVLGFLGATIFDEGRLALKVANSILNGQGGRLFRSLRDEQGLAYAVMSTSMEGIDPGFIAGYIATSHENAEKARLGLLEQFMGLWATRASKLEVDSAKRKLAGGYEMNLQENDFHASQMALDEIYGLGYRDYLSHAGRILKVTPDEVWAAASRYFGEDNWVAVVSG